MRIALALPGRWPGLKISRERERWTRQKRLLAHFAVRREKTRTKCKSTVRNGFLSGIYTRRRLESLSLLITSWPEGARPARARNDRLIKNVSMSVLPLAVVPFLSRTRRQDCRQSVSFARIRPTAALNKITAPSIEVLGYDHEAANHFLHTVRNEFDDLQLLKVTPKRRNHRPRRAAPALKAAPGATSHGTTDMHAPKVFTLRSGIAEGRMVYLGVGGGINGKMTPTIAVHQGDLI